MYGFDNGINTSMEFNLRFLEPPEVERGKEKIEFKEIPGKESSLTVHTGEYENTIITNVMDFLLKPGELMTEKTREIRSWANQSKYICYTGDDWFYKVKDVAIEDEKNTYDIIGNITIVFECDPFMYLMSGESFERYEAGTSELYNSYYKSWPVIHIPNYSYGDVITINGVDIVLYTDEDTSELYIDTERRIAYDKDKNVKNTLIKCDHLDECYLRTGKNQIIHAMELYVQPNWRCR